MNGANLMLGVNPNAERETNDYYATDSVAGNPQIIFI